QDRPHPDGKHGALGAVAGGRHALHLGPGRDFPADRALAAPLSGILISVRAGGTARRRAEARFGHPARNTRDFPKRRLTCISSDSSAPPPWPSRPWPPPCRPRPPITNPNTSCPSWWAPTSPGARGP